MGANGSGKTALLDALVAVARIAGQSVPVGAENPRMSLLTPFRSEAYAGRPTEFVLEFEGDWLAPGRPSELFRYELVVERKPWTLHSEHVRYEALYYFPKGRRRRLFRRAEPSRPIDSSVELGVTKNDPRFAAVRPDASVIATLAQLNVPVAMRLANWLSTLSILANVVHYEEFRLPMNRVVDLLDRVPKLSKWGSEWLQSSDIGISDFNISVSGGNKTISFDHKGLDRPIELYAESRGTQNLLQSLPQLYRGLDEGIPVVFDEIDGTLHVDIVAEILNYFRSNETNRRDSQFFVTTHNVGLLDELEKEELFIVEKTQDGATRVHGAQDVKGLRRDVRLYPKYRAGVPGGVPRIG